jgi:hypothetical protein
MANGTRLPHSDKRTRNPNASVRIHSGAHNHERPSVLSAIFAFFILLSLSSPLLFAQTGIPVDSTLTAIKSLYDNGSYLSAELQARRVLEDRHVNDTLRVQVEKYLGFTLVAQGRNEAAEEHFVNALRIDSSLALDPVLTSPKILTVFESAKARYLSEVAKKTDRNVAHPEIGEAARSGPSFRAVVFPGWEQLYQGKETKGYVLLGAGAASAIAAVASDLLRRDAKTNYLNASTPSAAESRYKTYNLYYKTEVYSVSAFVLIYIYSELDAFLNLPPNLDAGYSPSGRSMSLGFHIDF